METLKKILQRTERDVAVAGAVLGSVACMSKLFPVMEHYSTLQVHFYDKSWLSWDCVNSVPLVDPWRDFLKWYHGRPQSECYVLNHNEGCNMFRRSDVKGYAVTRGERAKAKTTR